MVNRNPTIVFIDHIRKSALKYFPSFGSEPIRVQLVNREERATAMLYRFKVSNESQIRSVFVKVPTLVSPRNPTNGNIYKKPLLYPKTDLRERHWLQYTALRTIYEYFTGLHKEQLGAIRVLDYLPQYHAIFTEESNDPRLRQLFLRNNRLYSAFIHVELITAFQNVGTWLRVYHAMPKEEDVQVRYPYRDDYIEAITKLTDFLAKTLGDERFFQETASIIINKGQEVLPEALPLGLGHGDYAMRNILIGKNARVTVLDTFAKWRTPIYEDIGYFLNELKMSYPQVISQGLAFSSDQLTAYECAFLKGYFDNKPIPYAAIRLFETLALLDKWSSAITKFFQQPKFIKSVGQLKLILINKYFKRRTKSLLAEIVKG